MSNPIPPENAAQAADALAQQLLQECSTLRPVTAVLQRNLARTAELSEQVAAHALDEELRNRVVRQFAGLGDKQIARAHEEIGGIHRACRVLVEEDMRTFHRGIDRVVAECPRIFPFEVTDRRILEGGQSFSEEIPGIRVVAEVDEECHSSGAHML